MLQCLYITETDVCLCLMMFCLQKTDYKQYVVNFTEHKCYTGNILQRFIYAYMQKCERKM